MRSSSVPRKSGVSMCGEQAAQQRGFGALAGAFQAVQKDQVERDQNYWAY